MPSMATAPILSALPDTFYAGTTVKYRSDGGDFPSTDSWTRTLYLAGASLLNVAGTPDSGGFLFTLTAAQTAPLKAGTYQWQEVGAKGSEKVIVATGTIRVLANIVSAGAGDLQSWEETTLKVVEDVLAGRITADVESYAIAGRQVTKIPVPELLSLRSRLKAAIEAQKFPGRLGAQSLVTFTSP